MDKLPENAHVICCNDSVELVVIGSEQLAKERLEHMAQFHFEKSKNNLTFFRPDLKPYDEYRMRCFWHFKTVKVLSEPVPYLQGDKCTTC